MPGARSGRGRNAGDGFTDPYPRTRPAEKEEPLTDQNWRMAVLHIEQALLAAKGATKDTFIRDNIAHNLNAALKQLHPTPSPE